MTLEDELNNLRERAAVSWSEAEARQRTDAADALEASGLVERALGPGDSAPDFTLADENGSLVSFTDLISKGPLIIVFYRGGWCPYCNLELRAWQHELDRIQPEGIRVVAISPETMTESASTATSNGLSFPALHDLNNSVARQFGIVHDIDDGTRSRLESRGIEIDARQGVDTAQLPLPATFVVDARGVIQVAYVSSDYTTRAEPASMIAAAKRLAGQLPAAP